MLDRILTHTVMLIIGKYRNRVDVQKIFATENYIIYTYGMVVAFSSTLKFSKLQFPSKTNFDRLWETFLKADDFAST